MRAILASLLLLAASAPALAQAALVLEDGQILEGIEVERRGELFFLELETGSILPVPADLVRELRLSEGAEGDDDDGPSGIVAAEPRTLVGPPGVEDLPDLYEQTAALGEPARFPRGPIDPTWVPRSDWESDPSLNDFNPARWYEAPIDPVWRPRSAFRSADDVTQFNPARWYRAPIESTWWPRDGWGERNRLFDDFEDEP